MTPKHKTSVHNVAADNLAKTGHSIFASLNYTVRDANGRELQDGWKGREIESVTVHEPTNITKSWRLYFWPNKFHAYIDGTLTREKATQAAEVLMGLVNIKRGGD